MDLQNTYVHEEVHRQLARYGTGGCKNDTINYKIFGRSTYICHNYTERSEEMMHLEYQMDVMNEIVTYNMKTAISVFILCFGLLSLIIVSMWYLE